jgi:hypothetical protein
LKIGPKIVLDELYRVEVSKQLIDLGFDLCGVLCVLTCHGDLCALKMLKKNQSDRREHTESRKKYIKT